MTIPLTGYRVFIASPGGLQEERNAFREALVAFNEDHAVPKGAIFLPIGWENAPGGLGRPQDKINPLLMACDYCVVLFHNRWGMPPAADSCYGSGTEEEFYTAVECKRDEGKDMSAVVLLFKAVDENQLGDPGPQLAKVLDFKNKLEEERTILFENFDDVRSFERKLVRHLGTWLREHEGALPVAERRSAFDEAEFPAPAGVAATTGEEKALADARELAGAGRRTAAEAILVREVTRGESALACVEYARFLRLDRRLTQALAMAARALEMALSQGGRAAEADARLELGMVYQAQENTTRAEENYQAALDLNVELGRDGRISDSKRNVGRLHEWRGDLDAAEAMYRDALAIDERLGRRDGMADDYSYLGSALQLREDLAGAEKMHQAALEIDTALGRLEEVAKHCGNLGGVLYMRGDWAGAEEMYRKALESDQKLGLLDAMADDFSNLGSVLRELGDLDGAKDMHEKAADIDKLLGRYEGVADHYENLAALEESRGCGEDAEAYRERARDARGRAEAG